MNDTAKLFFSDIRICWCVLIGCVGFLLPSRLLLQRWPFYGRLTSENVSFALPFMTLLIVLVYTPLSFDWSGELAVSVLFAFGFVYSIHLLWVRKWNYRLVGITFAMLYGFLIYDTTRAWVARAHDGSLTR